MKVLYVCLFVYLLPGFDALVGKIREGGTRDEAAHTGDDVQVPLLQDNLPLAYDH